jgi:hypothetical protein
MFARKAENSMYELAVANIEPKLQLPMAIAVIGCAHLLLRAGAISIETRLAIGIRLNRSKSNQKL